MKTFILDVSAGDFADLPFSSARVELLPETVERITNLMSAVRQYGAYKIVAFDYRVEPLPYQYDVVGDADFDLDTFDVRLDCVCMNVTTDHVFWSGYVKHSDERWETAGITLDNLSLIDGVHDLRDTP